MTWREFLTALDGVHSVTLIGPLADTPVTANGPTVFIDGGLRHIHAGPRSAPSVSVGDGDSGTLTLDHTLPTDKNYSDLAFVLKELPLSVNHLHMIGFLGGRRDHELANFGETQRFLDARPVGARVDFFGPHGLEVMGLSGDLTYEIQGVFSVMTFAPTHVEIGGDCHFPLEPGLRLSTLSSHGLSNMGIGRVRFSSQKPYFIFLNVNV